MTRLSVSICTFLLIISALSCSRMPESVISPSLSIEKSDNGFTGNFTAGLHNENPQRAFEKFRARISILDEKNSIIMEIPVNFETVLPFETAVVQKKFSIKNEKCGEFLRLIHRKESELTETNSSVNGFLDSRKVLLKDVQTHTVAITKLLESRRK